MADEKKSAYRHALEAASRFKRQLDGAKEQGEMIAGEVLRTGIGAGTSFVAGLVDERFGAVDEHGIRMHKFNGAPSALLAGAGLKVTAGFGLFGKMQAVGFAAGDGAIHHTAGTWGRMAGARLRALAAKTTVVSQPAQVGAKVETATAMNTAAPVAEKVAA